jgi:transposase
MTLRRGVRRGERDNGMRPGNTTAEQQRLKELEREVCWANKILKLASAYFAQAELVRHHKS